MGSVRSNGQIERFSHVSDLDKSGHPTAIGDISLRKRDPARGDHLLELVKRVQIFARRDRQSTAVLPATPFWEDRRGASPVHCAMPTFKWETAVSARGAPKSCGANGS